MCLTVSLDCTVEIDIHCKSTTLQLNIHNLYIKSAFINNHIELSIHL